MPLLKRGDMFVQNSRGSTKPTSRPSCLLTYTANKTFAQRFTADQVKVLQRLRPQLTVYDPLVTISYSRKKPGRRSRTVPQSQVSSLLYALNKDSDIFNINYIQSQLDDI